MFNTTNVTVVGRVVTDITTRVVTSGDKVANFRVACQERRYDKELGVWVDGDRMYVGVSCWRRLADGVSASLSMGDQVVVTGRLKIDEYEADGVRRAGPQIDARAVGPDLALHTALVTRQERETSPDQMALVPAPPDRRQQPEEEPQAA
jgi:single-strand DNA-binding protein